MGTTNAQTDSEHTDNKLCLDGNSIEASFAESSILITGATGFVGKALIEKLLRTCPRLAMIFVLIRPKKNQTVNQRFKELMDNPIFDRIREEFPSALNKVFPIKGDVMLPCLGLVPNDKNMLMQRVNIVFHSAATVRFNEPLKVAVYLNTRGTDHLIELCKKMTNLVSVVHVSTAYSNADRHEVKELIYTTKVNPHTVIDMCENLDDDILGIIEKKLVGNHPNTYTLTKNLAEQIVRTKGADLPIAIVRPSIICAAYQEPYPGWVDNICGLTGILTEITRGTVRSLVCNENLVVDLVPIDYVTDTLICAAWYNTVHHAKTLLVYNCTSSSLNHIRWKELGTLVKKYAIESPTKHVMWYPNFTFRTNKFIHNVMVIALQYLPAFILDLYFRFQGYKPFMMKLSKRLTRAAKNGEFFATNEWYFHRNNMENLMKSVKALSDGDRYNIDIAHLDWDSYLQRYILGIRKYILKDDIDTLKKARSRLVKLYWIQKFIQLFSIFILGSMLKQARR